MLCRMRSWLFLAGAIGCASLAWAQGCNNRFVAFGDSLSDPGNAYAALGVVSSAPFSVIPSAPYASHTFSNGPTWAQRLANSLNSPASGAPAFVAPGEFTNYAVGGARARSGTGSYDLAAEVSLYLSNFKGRACAGSVHVVWVGGDDLRDALTAFATAPTPAAGQAAAGAIIVAAVTSIEDNVTALWSAGARRFLILDAPDISHAPAVRMFGAGAIAGGAALSVAFNDALGAAVAQLQTLPGLRVSRYDDNAFVAAILAHPAAFELQDVLDPCLRFGVITNAVCEEPSEFLFWDGIHPTAAGHRLLARAVRARAFANRDD